MADVLSGAEFRYLSARSGLLLRAATGEMRRLFSLVQGLGLMVLLADANAMILARAVDSTHVPVSRRMHLQKGAIWDEAVAGTNGVGTAVRECRPIFLGQGEHWRYCFSLLASYAVPLFDAQGGVVGALNLAALNGNSTRPLAPLVMEMLLQSGRRIEEALFRDCHVGQSILTLGTAEGCSSPLVSINGCGEVTGATRAARALIGWTDDKIAERPKLLHELEAGEAMSFQKAEESVVRSALVASGGDVMAAARSLGISRATLYRKMRAFGVT
ncbi:Fis family transcriptional regulator [Ameyamaea chiangmaiensis NBRC 103196]|nr:Fis family transcriptional regulator [Ameyamaea chiangmaiensis NBRC 103196]